MFEALLRAKVQFFDANPIGKVISSLIKMIAVLNHP
jgi:hypothetical protein